MTDRKKKHTYSLGVVLLALIIGLLVGVMYAPRVGVNHFVGQNGGTSLGARVDNVMQYVGAAYVDDVDYDSVSEVMMTALMSSLDPHSCYLTPKMVKEEDEMMNSNFEGVGILLYYYGDTVCVSSIVPHSPASRVDIRPGDRIMYVDTTRVSGRGLTEEPSQIVNMIRGPRHSMVTIGVQRKGSKKLKYVKIQRDVIQQSSIPAALMLDKQTGYIYISHFSLTTGTEFRAALLQLNREGMKHLVLDLRGNPGGSLGTAVSVADELLPKGDLIVYTEGAHSRREDAKATAGGLFETGRLTVLINSYSASASEIVSGAVQDNDRGVVVGHRSFGKGLVQRQFELPDGAAMRLTIARYYSPSGRCIQRPYDKGGDEYYSDWLTEVMKDYMMTDSVLRHAYDTTNLFYTKKGRKVYGGGGIQPDVSLPYFVDTNLVYFNKLIDSKAFEETLMDELFEEYGNIVKRYPTLEDFVKGYEISETTWQKLLAKADKRDVHPDKKSIEKYGKEMRARYKAQMAKSLFGENAYYDIIWPYDIELQKALRVAPLKLKNK